jgi:DNA-binding XRE family transcriptional regulator
MKDRIRQIMETQHMTQQVFAQFIGMSPASLSSIFNERTKPSINIVEAIKKKIPDINTEWLLFGEGPMYSTPNSSVPTPSGGASGGQESLFNFSDEPSNLSEAGASMAENHGSVAIYPNSVKSTRPISAREEIKNIDKPARRVTEIRVFYDDQTWESFVPAKK